MTFSIRDNVETTSFSIPKEGETNIQILKVEDKETWQAWQVTARTIPTKTQGDPITFTFTQSYRNHQVDDNAYTWCKRFLDALFIGIKPDGSLDLDNATKQIRAGIVSHWENEGSNGQVYTNVNFRFEYEGSPADGILKPIEDVDLKWLDASEYDKRHLPAPV